MEPDKEVLTLVERLKSEPAKTRPLPAQQSSQEVDPSHPSRRSWTRLGVAALLILAAVLISVAVLARRNQAPTAPRRSIAVLPFEDLGPGRANAYFSDGLTEEIIGALSQVDSLRVAARSSSFALRGVKLDARAVGDTLRVATLLEGSVRREKDRVRVTARLVDATNGYQIWSRSYDRRIEDVIALQNEIASSIVGALQLELAPRTARYAPNAEAYDLYLRGMDARNRLTGEDLRRAIDYFDRAIRLDSNYAPAYAGKATTVTPMVWFGHLPRAQGLAAMSAAAARAVSLDESLSEAHVALGMKAFFYEWDWMAGERQFRRATEVNPNDAHAQHFLANSLRAMGRFDEAIAARRRALTLDPLSVRTAMLLGADYFMTAQYDSAVKYYRLASEMGPRLPIVLEQGPGVDMGLGHAFEQMGRIEEAFQEHLKVDSLNGLPADQLAQLRAAYGSGGIRGYWRARVALAERERKADPVRLAWMSARSGDGERTVRYIERAYREHSLGLVFLGVMPTFEGARRDPRVVAIMRAMRLRPLETSRR